MDITSCWDVAASKCIVSCNYCKHTFIKCIEIIVIVCFNLKNAPKRNITCIHYWTCKCFTKYEVSTYFRCVSKFILWDASLPGLKLLLRQAGSCSVHLCSCTFSSGLLWHDEVRHGSLSVVACRSSLGSHGFANCFHTMESTVLVSSQCNLLKSPQCVCESE